MHKSIEDLARRWLKPRADGLSLIESRVLESTLERKTISTDLNKAFVARQTFGDRLADNIARFGGSWSFILSFIAFLVVWTGVNTWLLAQKAFDPYRKSCYKKGPDGTLCDVENRVHVCGGCRGGKWACTGPNGGGCGSTDRTLTSLCAHYGVVHAGAHDCADDAIATVRLLWKLLEAWPEMARWKLETLHQHQVGWRADQQAGLRKFFDKVGKDHDGMCPAWPVHTAACAGAHRQAVAA